MTAKRAPLEVGGVTVAPGRRAQVDLPVARLPTGTEFSLRVELLHGAHPGPSLWMNAAIHGDELNGVEIIRQVISRLDTKKMHGTVLAVPIVNLYGFVHQTRYLPDRRDLNRAFPGTARGSLAARLAHLFVQEVVSRCDYGLDYHTASHHRTNVPQIRANLGDVETRRLAMAFGAPFMVQGKEIRGSLRATAVKKGVTVLVFEGGEPLRFNEDVIEVGVAGSLRVLEGLEVQGGIAEPRAGTSCEIDGTRWVRASRSGVFHRSIQLGDRVEKKDPLGWITDPFSEKPRTVKAPIAGFVLGHTNNPLVYQGDAVVHLAQAVSDD